MVMVLVMCCGECGDPRSALGSRRYPMCRSRSGPYPRCMLGDNGVNDTDSRQNIVGLGVLLSFQLGTKNTVSSL